jgi:hypothetical protein
MTTLTIFDVVIKDDNKVHIIGNDIDVEASVSIRPKLATILANIAPNISIAPKDVGLDVMIQVVDVKKLLLWKNNTHNYKQ